MIEPSILINSCTLSLRFPPTPLETPPTSPGVTPSAFDQEDQFISHLLQYPEPERSVHYDESFAVYLVVQLPDSIPLTRSQARTILLPTSSTSPHLSLSLELSYLPPTILSNAIPTPSRPRAHSSESSPFTTPAKSHSQPRSTLNRPSPLVFTVDGTVQSRSSDHDILPETPKPKPATARNDRAYTEAQGIVVASQLFQHAAGMSEDNRVAGRVWIGREGGDEGTGGYVGVYEFISKVGLNPTIVDPRLCMTVTVTFRDDPRLADLLEWNGTSRDDSNAAAEEYMIESFDDVNLLEGLDDRAALHLPTSRLPLPSSSTSSAVSISSPPTLTRSTHYHRRSLSLAGAGDAPTHPTIRRAFRRVVDVRSAVFVKMRTVNCPSSRLLNSTNGGRMSSNEGGGDEGMVICIEVEGAGEEGGDLGFSIESIQVTSSGGPGAGDTETKLIRPEDHFPLVLNSTDQHNFLYAVLLSSSSESASNVAGGSTGQDDRRNAIPIVVATSPSQRFTARFDDCRPSDSTESLPPTLMREDSTWLRNISIVVRGRPVRLSSSSSASPSPSTVITNSISPPPESSTSVSASSSTASFDSRWNYVLDISSMALRAQSKRTSFLTTASFDSTSASIRRATALAAERESVGIAGSKRHTSSNLLNLSIKSASSYLPHLTDSPATTPTQQSYSRLDALGLNGIRTRGGDSLPTPGATGPARRFFSTPAPISSSSSSTIQGRAIVKRTVSGSGSSSTMRKGSMGLGYPMHALPLAPHEGGQEYGREHDRDEERLGEVIISVGLVPFSTSAEEEDLSSTAMISSRVKLLDIFLVEVFVLNRGDTVKRFTIGVPYARSDLNGEGEEGDDARLATIVALDQDVRIGPLAPHSCHSVRLRFLAIRPGAHVIDQLRIVDVATGIETRLNHPLRVVVQ